MSEQSRLGFESTQDRPIDSQDRPIVKPRSSHWTMVQDRPSVKIVPCDQDRLM